MSWHFQQGYFYLSAIRTLAILRGFSSLKNQVVVRMVILILSEWPFPSARNGHSNDFRLAILMGIRLVILISTQWPFPNVLHCPRFRREVHTYQVKLAPIRLEGAGILVVLDLPEGFFGGLVELQFYNIDVVFC